MASFRFTFIPLSDVIPVLPTDPPFTTTGTVSESGTFLINPLATPVLVELEDDDENFDDGFIDPPGLSTADNNQLLTAPVTANGTTFPIGSQVELEFSITTTAGDTFFVVRIDGVNVGLTAADSFPEPLPIFTIDSSADGVSTPFDPLVCFCAGTRLDTPDGPRAIETLAVGDLVLTADAGPHPVRWTGTRELTALELAARPHLRPIRIRAGALGNRRDILVSPQHRILIADWRAELLFGEAEVFAPALALLNGRSIVRQGAGAGATYVHVLFDDHQIVFTDGLASESLHPGPQALEAVTEAGRAELIELFPELADPELERSLARPTLRRYEAEVLASL
ncbi:MAG: Hint domain-containing protein [Pseudomonadota bacterium]